ncbi:hypothetical protein TanjilG_30321 [Lupinus angustifolius]|nr:hypothetical protein TanjilG_30321 [Lupinus angustifolius]
MRAEKKWLLKLFTAAFLSLILLLFSSFSVFNSQKTFPAFVQHCSQNPPSFAYFISGGNKDKDRILRLLLAIYHPRNRYLLHLGKDARDEERQALATAVRSVPAIRAFGNVDVVGKADWVTYLGSSNVAITLRAAAIMLKLDNCWNWFITLSARDYPLITQDGSPWVVLSRPFLEFCIFGWDNLPRILLMYFTNIKLPQEGYFHSVICNAPEFKNTTVNGDLRFMTWDNPPKMEPLFLNSSVYNQMAGSGAAFARQFEVDNYVLDMIDDKILRRGRNRATPGAWCTGRWSWWMDPCSWWGDVNIVKPGPQAKKLEGSISSLVDDLKSQTNQCQ